MISEDIITGDCVEVMANMEPESVDAIVTDPPYELGFMGKTWDSSGVSYQKQTWEAALRVLKPGGHVLAFGGTRTYHRLACAIEDAGFEIRDTICWLYGSGFPKSLDVSKAIDKAAGAEREVVGSYRSPENTSGPNGSSHFGGCGERESGLSSITAPATPEAKQWNGWGTALKPAWESIILAKKPELESHLLSQIGSCLDRLETWLAQEVESIIQTGEEDGSPAQMDTSQSELTVTTFSNIVTSWRNCWIELWTAENTSTTSMGIRPTTDWKTLLSCLLEITLVDTTPDLMKAAGWRSLVEAVDNLFAGAIVNLRGIRALSVAEHVTGHTLSNSLDEDARYPAHEPILVARKPLIGTVAANVLEHGTGAINVDGCRVGTEQVKTRVNPLIKGGNYGHYDGRKLNQKLESVHTGRWPANIILDEEAGEMLNGQARFFYCAKASRAERGEGNNHPTVKPLALMRYLVRLVTPPQGTVLDPFTGSGTTGIAAKQDGFNFIGIEREPEYVAIARARIAAAGEAQLQLT